MGAAFLSLSMGFTGLPRAMAELIEGYNLSPVALIAVSDGLLPDLGHVYGWPILGRFDDGHCGTHDPCGGD